MSITTPTTDSAGPTTSGFVAIIDGYLNPTSTTWTSATALNTAFAVNTNGFDTVILTLVPGSTFTTGVVTFEVYDGVTWLPVKASRIESYLTDGSYAVSGNPGSRAWQIPVSGFPQFRARLSTAITGAGNLLATIITSSAPDTSVVTVGVDPASYVNSQFVENHASTSTTVQSASSAWAAAVTNGGGALGTAKTGVHFANTGLTDMWVGTTTACPRWVVPAGSDRQIGATESLYVGTLAGVAATSYFATEYSN